MPARIDRLDARGVPRREERLTGSRREKTKVGAYPVHDRVNDWIWQTVVREGANIHMGFELPRVMEQAGLSVERVRAVAEIEYGAEHTMFEIARAMQARIVQQGVATEAAIDIETLEERLAAERNELGSPYVRSMSFGAWARKP